MLAGALKWEKALVGAFSVIVKSFLFADGSFAALLSTSYLMLTGQAEAVYLLPVLVLVASEDSAQPGRGRGRDGGRPPRQVSCDWSAGHNTHL